MTTSIRHDAERAERVIRFLELLPITEGRARGQRSRLGEWQKEFIRAIYSPIHADTGRRVVERAVLSVARKNGKSLLVAGLLLCHLVGPESEPNGQIYSCANDRAQAAVIFDMCRKMIVETPSLSRVLGVVASTKTIFVKPGMSRRAVGSTYKALSSESTTKHGLGPTFFVFDEFGESKPKDPLFDTMIDGQANAASPLAVVISTQNPDPEHPLAKLLIKGALQPHEDGFDPTLISRLFAADENCDLLDEEQWLKANPALADWKDIGFVRTKAHEAKGNPLKEQGFRRRYLNQRVSIHSSLISRPDWAKCQVESVSFRPGEPLYLGLDFSQTTDLTALVAVSAENGSRAKAWFWKPEAVLEEHAKRDDVSFDVHAKRGFLDTSPGRTIDPNLIAHKIASLVQAGHPIVGLAYDRWRIDEFLRILDGIGLRAQDGLGDGIRLVPWGQGFRDMAPAIDAFEAAILTGELSHDGHPLLTWTVANALAISDPAGNRKLDKAKSHFRIDGAVALAMALGLKARDRKAVEVVNPWADPNFSLV